MRVLGVCLALCTGTFANARVIPPCSAEVCASSCIIDLCSDLLPKVDTVLLSQGDGYCWCQCPELAAAQLEEVLEVRLRRYSLNRQFASPPSALTTEEACGTPRLIRSDTMVTDWQPCFPEYELIETIKEIKRGLPHPLNDFNVLIDSEICDLIWPRNQPSSIQAATGGYTRQQIFYPLRFLYDKSVHDELRMFILLHEIGHDAMRYKLGSEQPVNEFMADEWAARIGLPLVFGPAWTVHYGADYLDSVVTQLRKYHYSQYLRGTAELANADTAGPNNYPELDCRVRGIQGYYTVDAKGNCGATHPDSCWDQVFTGLRLDSCSFPQRTCDPLSTVVVTRSSFRDLHLEVVPISATLNDDLLGFLRPCLLWPCDCEGNVILPSRTAAMRYERSRKRMIKHLHRAADRIRSYTKAAESSGK